MAQRGMALAREHGLDKICDGSMGCCGVGCVVAYGWLYASFFYCMYV